MKNQSNICNYYLKKAYLNRFLYLKGTLVLNRLAIYNFSFFYNEFLYSSYVWHVTNLYFIPHLDILSTTEKPFDIWGIIVNNVSPVSKSLTILDNAQHLYV